MNITLYVYGLSIWFVTDGITSTLPTFVRLTHDGHMSWTLGIRLGKKYHFIQTRPVYEYEPKGLGIRII